MIRNFTKKLADLYVQGELSLAESLKILGNIGLSSKENVRKKSGKIEKTAVYLFNQLEYGNLISNAFQTCPYIRFEESYVSFIALAEKTGELREAFDYLNSKYERQHQNRLKFIEVSVYPIFVITISIAGCLFLMNYTGTKDFSLFMKLFAGMIGICLLILMAIKKGISANPLYEPFLVMDFLIKAGVGIAGAAGCAIQLLGINSRYGAVFEEAREKLEFGMSLKNAFKLGAEYEEVFYYAEKTGNKNEVFGRMAELLRQRDERRRIICMNMLEPVFIFITGLFLMILIMNFFMPYITDLQVL